MWQKKYLPKSIKTDFERGIRKAVLRKKMVDPRELLTGSIVKLFKDEITDNPLEIILPVPNSTQPVILMKVKLKDVATCKLSCWGLSDPNIHFYVDWLSSLQKDLFK